MLCDDAQAMNLETYSERMIELPSEDFTLQSSLFFWCCPSGVITGVSMLRMIRTDCKHLGALTRQHAVYRSVGRAVEAKEVLRHEDVFFEQVQQL